jgi:hypothetical protein
MKNDYYVDKEVINVHDFNKFKAFLGTKNNPNWLGYLINNCKNKDRNICAFYFL